MSTTLKTFGAIGIALVALGIYLATFVFGLYFIFYGALGLTFVMLAVMVVLTAGSDLFGRPK